MKENNFIVITSKQDLRIPKRVKRARIVVKDNCIVWKFRNEDEACVAMNEFCNCGFDMVRRA